ncbi:MAG: methyltransferase domain-containing protein [Longimicrobiales bacterium]
MILDPSQVRDRYRSTAPFYDRALLLYRLVGLGRHRRRAVEALDLQPGDTVVDLGCGTGANFTLLHDTVGPEGRIVGVDLTDAMLERARRRAEDEGFDNVVLVEANVVDYELPARTAGVLATFALEMVPEYPSVIRRTAEALEEGGRLVLLGLKHPEGWPDWLVDLGVWINRPFGVSRDYAEFRPWQSLRQYFTEIEFREMLAGAAYMAVGRVPPGSPGGLHRRPTPFREEQIDEDDRCRSTGGR